MSEGRPIQLDPVESPLLNRQTRPRVRDWGPEYFEVTVQNRQTLEDLALWIYGAVEGVLFLLVDNTDRLEGGLAPKLYAGLKLRARKGVYLNREVVMNYVRAGIVPANGEDAVDTPIVGPDYNDDYNDDYNT